MENAQDTERSGIVLLVLTLIWLFAAGRVIYYTGDAMTVFHPLIFSLLLYGCCLCLAAMIACFMQKWRLAAVAAGCVVLVALLFLQGYRIQDWAWTRSIRLYDETNQAAIRQCASIPELTDKTVVANLWDGKGLAVLDGFGWYCQHQTAALGNAFRAFRYRGVVHVRIQKIKWGYRGIAFVPSASDRQKLKEDGSPFTYGPLILGHWLVWRAQG